MRRMLAAGTTIGLAPIWSWRWSAPTIPRRDLIDKRKDYTEAGIPEYWIAMTPSPARSPCSFYRAMSSGSFRGVPARESKRARSSCPASRWTCESCSTRRERARPRAESPPCGVLSDGTTPESDRVRTTTAFLHYRVKYPIMSRSSNAVECLRSSYKLSYCIGARNALCIRGISHVGQSGLFTLRKISYIGAARVLPCYCSTNFRFRLFFATGKDTER